MAEPRGTTIGPTIDEIVVADEIDSWADAGFDVDPDAVCRVGSVRIRIAGRSGGRGILDWSLRDVDPSVVIDGAMVDSSIDGIPTRVSTAAPAEPGIHPNHVRYIDHIVLLTPDQQRTVTALEATGLRARRTRHTDTYGAPFLQTFFRAGEVIVELIGPEAPSDNGPAGFFGLAYTVDDLDATATLLGAGCGQPKEAVQPGRRIATLRHRSFDLSVATAFMSAEPTALDSP